MVLSLQLLVTRLYLCPLSALILVPILQVCLFPDLMQCRKYKSTFSESYYVVFFFFFKLKQKYSVGCRILVQTQNELLPLAKLLRCQGVGNKNKIPCAVS